MFARVLVANRGEIAVRVIRALEELGVESVAVYSELDRNALHARRADAAYLLGGAKPAESYLNIARILEVARESGAEAIHPGYGFLAENASFAAACEEAGIVFIGPPASAIEAMGSKTRARELMAGAGVPIVPGTTEPVASAAEARRIIESEIGYPVAVKAAGGGGGKGFRVALAASELEDRRGANGRQFVEAVMSPDDHGVHRSVGGEHAEHLLAHRRVAYANHLTFGMSRVCERAEEVEHRRDPELAPHRYRMAHRGVKARREAEPDAGLGDALGHAGGAEIDHHPERFKDVS